MSDALIGRGHECGEIDRLVAGVQAGHSRVLIVRGEPGAGKTALLDYLATRATGCDVLRAAGVEAEAGFAFAGLQRLCAPLARGIDHLPEPQRDALAAAFGLQAGNVPDRFLVGLALHGLLMAAGRIRPTVCIVDDLQWLDTASAEALAFVARRLRAESVGLVVAVRLPDHLHCVAGLPKLDVPGLADDDARALLDGALAAPLDTQIRDRVIIESGGNPRALLELPRRLSPEQLAGGFGLARAFEYSTPSDDTWQGRLSPLPPVTRRLLSLAALEPAGDPAVLWRAASELELDLDAAAPAINAGLIESGPLVAFRHPAARAAACRGSSAEELRVIHRALANATDASTDPDRRAWHLAQAASGPDEDVAAELERSVDRARSRGGLPAAAAFLERATELSPEVGPRARRALRAAHSKHLSGAQEGALRLIAIADARALSDLERARARLLRAQVTATAIPAEEGSVDLVDAARKLGSLDPTLSHEAFLDAFAAALLAHEPTRSVNLRHIADAVLDARSSDTDLPGHRSRLLIGIALLVRDGYTAATSLLREALDGFREDVFSDEESARWLGLGCWVARAFGDEEAWRSLADKWVRVAGDLGALSRLPIALAEQSEVELAFGEDALAAGEERDGTEWWLHARLLNSVGRWEEALGGARSVDQVRFSPLACAELVEAAARSGCVDLAAEPLRRLGEISVASETDWALGIDARSRALVSSRGEAEQLYRRAIEHLDRTRVRVDVARAHLVYGEWLRREGRRLEARGHLRSAYDLLSEIGDDGFAARARRELLATGERVRRRVESTRGDLTAQEVEIAHLAAEGHTNPEIGARLFISPRTVQYHLRKVFQKLGVRSRGELHSALPDAVVTAQAVAA